MSEQIQQNKDEPSEQIDQSVMDTLRSKDHSILAKKIDPLNCSHNDIVELLAHYIALSEQDNDDLFDTWFDNLNTEQHTILKTFEVYRGQYEHLD